MQEKMQFHIVDSISETINMAEGVENFLLSLGNSLPKLEHLKARGGVEKGSLLGLPKNDKGVPLDPYPQNTQDPIKCYRYQGLGHKSNNYPKRRKMRRCEHQSMKLKV